MAKKQTKAKAAKSKSKTAPKARAAKPKAKAKPKKRTARKGVVAKVAGSIVSAVASVMPGGKKKK